jgi:hypothetical protein
MTNRPDSTWRLLLQSNDYAGSQVGKEEESRRGRKARRKTV